MALFHCAINEKCCSDDGRRGTCLFLSSPPRGIWQLKSPHRSVRGWGVLGAGGIDCIMMNRILFRTAITFSASWLVTLSFTDVHTVEPRYFEGRSNSHGFILPLYASRLFETPLFRTFFHFPWDFEIAGFDGILRRQSVKSNFVYFRSFS